jgi:DNA helicase-2/ATP-dependent DNA helicase PcrA
MSVFPEREAMSGRGKIWETSKCLSQAKVAGRGPEAPMEGNKNGSPEVARKFSLPNKHSVIPVRLEDSASREIGSTESVCGKVEANLPFIALTKFGRESEVFKLRLRVNAMSVLEQLLSDLDEMQREAVTAPDGPIMVFAGAGSGKTRVLTYRIAYLLLVRRIPPHRILAVTFTNKAADEMRQRLETLVGKAIDAMWLGTFHAACARMLRQHGQAIGLPPDFVIYDEDDQRSLIKAIFEELNIDPDRFSVAAVHSAISDAKTEMVSPEELAEIAETPFQQVVARVYRRYQEALRQARAVDFDDLLLLALKMLKENPQVADYYQTRFLHVLVDEYQDVNRPQHELTLLLSEKHRNLFVIGDDDQNIYSWRGSDVRLMLELPKRFPDLQIFTLERNYRSTQTILDTAWHVIRHNKHRHEKRLKAVREKGEPVVLFRAQDDFEEAAFVASIVSEWVREGKYRYSDFAVIYRINAQSRPFEETFLRWGIPYRVVGALRFYERKEVKDIIAYLRILVNPADEVSLLRVINLPPRGIGERTIERLRQFASQHNIPILEAILSGNALALLDTRARLAVSSFANLVKSLKSKMDTMPLPQFIQHTVEVIGYADYVVRTEGQLMAQERLENLAQLVDAAERLFPEEPASQTLPRFLEQLALLSPQDEANWQSDVVTLITAHSAKGLEFSVVFVVGLEEGLFPHARSLDDSWQLEEERRLFYVALTRAKDRAFLTYAQRRGWLTGKWGEARYAPTEPSRFLNEVPLSFLDEWRGVPTPQGFLRMKEPTVAPSGKIDVREIVRVLPVRKASELAAKEQQIGELKNRLRIEDIRVGMKVKHQQFGIGTIVAIEPDENLPIVVVRFDDRAIGEKRLALDFAPLEPLS